MVPAFPYLYGTLDKNLSHKRRYTIKSLRKMLEKEGFRVTQTKYINFFGILGWWLDGKILKRQILAKSHLFLYESLVPLFKKFESLIGPPAGLSILAVCEKKDEKDT